MSTEVLVRFTREGFHQWADAPPHRAYLAHRHRHLFFVEVMVEVRRDDREIEFHDLLDYCRSLFPGGDLGGASCEQVARALWEAITQRYPGRRVTVGVFEDGEVGARVTA
jgi:hypothetical protein